MASSGQAAWTKYFQGKGNIPTVMKKSSPVYDNEKINQKIADITAGTKVTYLASKKFESKATVEYVVNRKTIIGRVPFDNIAKPGVKASGAASLKPQAFGVGEQKYSFSVYRRTVMESIESRKDLSAETRTYLLALFDYHSGGSINKQKLTKIFQGVKDSVPLSDINKDFGEVLGPVAILDQELFRKNKIILNKSGAKIYVPARPNEPLMDYAIYNGDKQYTISAKSGTTTNVVKPPDILSLLSKDAKKLKKWSKTKEYRILQILAQESIILGPIKAISEIYPNLILPAAAASVSGKSYDKKGFANFISKNEYLKSKKDPTVNEIMYECEKMLQKQTKDQTFDMTELFADAIENQVFYVKFGIDSSGVGDWSVIVSDDIRKSKSGSVVYLRSKNGYTRASDRMGIQV
jgi:hypothetical protein